ncbi:MAG: hypothetical protein ABI895_24690 [Deltaproteobacteria bacterium]
MLWRALGMRLGLPVVGACVGIAASDGCEGGGVLVSDREARFGLSGSF